MRDAILASIRSRPFTTFQELTIEIAGFHGNYGMFNETCDTMIMWHACSEEAIAALSGLLTDRFIRMMPAPNISYRATNDLPTVPLCRDEGAFEEDTQLIRWFPVVFTEVDKHDLHKI